MMDFLLTAIPLHALDYNKLETLLRKIPAAYVKTEIIGDVERKFYSFPKLEDKGFRIDCSADHYLGSQLPSKTKCDLTVFKEIDARVDEHEIEFKDPFVVKSFFEAINYGTPQMKTLYSNEYFQGIAVNGKFQKLYRFIFNCSLEKCRLTVSDKPVTGFTR